MPGTFVSLSIRITWGSSRPATAQTEDTFGSFAQPIRNKRSPLQETARLKIRQDLRIQPSILQLHFSLGSLPTRPTLPERSLLLSSQARLH
ncbi:hypothetical protein AVEN_193155-1 [Araneus ventricosus]|uniref:Uncharacterized protein n=1 Tax=Araneus ventricosus TaxID=182803 RepID=A0A4Y2B030_ARAVE|nr:hypothetical protein AVEN_193155-1 [Araneus ventricosus]